MASPIQLYVHVRRFNQMLSIVPSQMTKKWTLTWQNLLVLFIQIQMIISLVAYCLLKAEFIFEYYC